MTAPTTRGDALADAIRPTAQQLVTAVDNGDKARIARLLTNLDIEELYALAVVLAAHVDVVIVDRHPRRRDFDEVVVRRIIACSDWSLAKTCTTAERREVVRLWREAGESLQELERLTGWKRTDRDVAELIGRGAA